MVCLQWPGKHAGKKKGTLARENSKGSARGGVWPGWNEGCCRSRVAVSLAEGSPHHRSAGACHCHPCPQLQFTDSLNQPKNQTRCKYKESDLKQATG